MSSTVIVSAGGRIEGLVASAAGTDTTAVVVGPREAATQAAATGVDRVVWLGDPGAHATEAWAGPVVDLVAGNRPDLVLASTHTLAVSMRSADACLNATLNGIDSPLA